MAVLSREEFYQQYDAAKQQGMDSNQAINYLAQAAVAAQPYNKQTTPTAQKIDIWQPGNRVPTRSEFNAERGITDTWQPPKTQQPTYNANAALKNLQNIAATTTDKQLAKMITRYTSGDAKKDNFWGQTAASFGSGKINELLNQAWGRYAEDGKAESKAIADAYAQLAEYYQNVNAEALDDKNRKLKWISQDMAQYAPQFLEQTKASAAPILGGAAAGAVIGEMITPIPGADALIGALAGGVKGAMGGTVAGTKVGGMIGAGKYSYNTMRGAAMKSLLEAGATTEQAQEASRDEAIISTAIENLDNAADLFLLIPGMGGIGKAAAKTALGKFAEWAGNVAQEGGEEFIQELISIANERRVKNGTTGDGALGLAKEVMALGQEIAKDAKNSDDLKQALEAARGGAVIGAFMGPTGAAVNKVITGPMQNTALNAINDLAPNQTVAQQNRNYIAESNADSRAREEVSDYIRSTNGLSNEESNARTKAYNEYSMQLDQAKRKDVLVDGDGKLVGQVKGIAGNGFTLQTKDGSEAVFRSEASGSLDKNGAIYKALQSGGEFISEKEYAERQAQAEEKVTEAAETAPATPEMPEPEMVTQEQLVQEAPAEMPSESPVSALENEGTSIADEAPESSTMQSDELVGQANEEAAQYANNRNADSSYRGIPVRIKPSKDGSIKVSVAKPRANGIGYTKQFTQIGTAKSVAEANQMIKSYFSTAQNAKSETNIKAKEQLSDNDELALLEGGSTKHSRQVKAQSSSEALTPSEVSALSNREVNQRLNKYAALARTAATGDNAVDVLLNFLGGNMKPETSVQNVNKAFYEQSLIENVLNDYDEDYVPSTDGKSTFQPTEEQIREILALIERKQTAAQEYREKKNNEEANPIPPDERKGREKSAEVDKTFGALAEDAEIPEMFLPDEDSNTDLPYDPNKVKEFMAERNNDNVAERLELLRELFPDADFRISHDADYTLDERASLPSDYLNADEYGEDEQRNKSNGEAFIEVVRGHETYGALGESPTKGDKYEKSWMKQHGWADAISTWKEEGNDRRQVYSSFELIPNGHIDSKTGEWTPNKALTDVKEDGKRGNRQYSESLVVTKPDGTRQVYYLKAKDGLYRHIINSNINEGITKVIQRHEARVRELEQRINRGYEFAEHPNQFLDSKDINANTSEKALQLVKKLEKELEAEKNWLGGLDYKPEGTYTLAKFFADNKGVVTQEDKDLVKSYLNEDIGRDISGFSFQGLGNSMSKEFAMELIDSIFKEAPDGQTQYNESFNAGKTSAGSQNPADFRTAEGRQPSSISERTEPFDHRVVNGVTVIENAPAQASAPDLRRSSGTGEIMDDTGAIRPVSGETSGLQARNVSDSEITELANRATQDINDAFEEPVTIRKRGGQPGRTLQAKQLNSELFLDGNAVGEINPSSYSGRLQQVAAAIKKAAQEYGLATVQLNGTLIRQHTAKDGSNYTSRLNAYADLNEGFIAIGELTEENASQILNDALHEITHGVTDSYFGADNEQTVTFVSGIAEKCKIKDFEKKIQKVIDAYSDNGTFDAAVADELISRFAEGDDCGGMFTQAELEKLQDALFNSGEWKEATGNSDYYNQLADFSRTQLRNRIEPEALSKARPGTDVGYDIAKPPTQETPTSTYYPTGERETNRTLSERTQQLTNDAIRALALGDFDKAQELLKQASSLPKNADNGMYSDEMVDMYQSSQKKAFRAKEDLSFTDDKEADIEDVMRMIEEDRKKPSLADYKASRDAMDAESRAETTRKIEESFDEHRETNPEARKATQAERFGVKGDDNPLNLAKKVAEQSVKLKEKSVLNNDRKRAKMFGENKAAQRAKARFNGYMDVLSKAANAEADVAELFSFASKLKDDPEMGVYVNEKVLNNLRKAAQLEEESAQTPTPDVVNAYKYQATKAMAMAAQQAENVDRVQSTIQSGLIEAALKYSKGNTDNVLVKGAQWLNRMQLNPGNFFRMIGGYDKDSRNTGYAMQQRVDRQNAVRITTEARLKDFFSGIKNDKQYRDFANGKTKSDVVMGDHKLSMLQAVQFKMLCDTLGIDDIRTSRLETLNGFALRDAGGNDTFVEMEGNTQAERYAWASQLYDQAVKSINENSTAKAYMEAAAKMFEDVKPDLISVGEKVDGFPKAMYAEGKYLPLSYASKDGHPMDWTLTNDMSNGLSATRIMQERVRENGGYAVIKPVSQTVDSYISQAANYIAYAELGNDLSIMGDANSLYGSLQNTIAKNFGDTYAQWLTNYTDDVNQIKSVDPTGLNKVLAKARTMMQQGALLGSLSVPIKQISSYFSAMGVVDPRAVMKAYSPIRRSGNNIIDYLYKSRLQGSIDPDVSQALNSGWVEKLKKSGKIGEAVVNATNIMDSRTVANVYQACCYDVEMNSGLSMDEIYKDGDPKKGLTNAGELLVHSLFSEAVLNTQPIFNRQARAEIARTSSEALRMLSVFRTQQTQNYNRLLTTINEAKAAKKFSGDTKSANREMRQTIGGQVAAAASISALTILADMLLHKHKKYKDEDDEFDEGKILDRFALNFVEAGAGTALFAGDATKWLIDQIKGNTGDYASNKEFYGISMGAISSLKSAMNAWTWLYSDMLKGGKHAASDLRYAVNYTATLLGIPTQNAYNLMNSFYQYTGDMLGKDIISGYGSEKYEDAMKEWDAIRNDFGNKLYSAVRAGNTAKAKESVEQMGDKLLSMIKTSSMEQLKSGDADDDEVLNVLMTYGNRTAEEAADDVMKMHLQIDTGYTSLTGTGKQTAETAYTDGKIDRAEFKKLYTKYSGKTPDQAEYSINRIDFKQKYPGNTYQDIKKMYMDGKLSKSEAAEWRYKTQENTTKESAENWVKNLDFQKMTGYEANYTSTSDLYDTYESKEKLGVISFYDKYGKQFSSPKAFGDVFNYLNNNERTNYPTYKTSYGETSKNQSRVITLMNELIQQKKITYDMAKKIWSEHYGWSTGNKSAWVNVKG